MNSELEKKGTELAYADDRTITAGPANELVNPDQEPDLTGKFFANKYEIIEVLGKGGMSTVYKARHTSMSKIVALKVLQTHLANDPLSLARFKQEASACSKLTHAGIAAVYDYGEGDNMPYIVMEYVEGATLSQLIRHENVLSEERFLHIFQQVSSALVHAHEQGVIHRDLKPSNIMITCRDGNDQVKILDFGIAKLVDASETAQHLTQTGELFGSPLYMSPEQCSGSRIDARSDVYSLGCVMFEALTGDVPFRGASVVETIHKHVSSSPPSLTAPQLSEYTKQKIELIILRCLAKNPNERFASMSALETELRSLGQRASGGFFNRIGGAWDLAAAKRRAASSSKMGALVGALVACFVSIVLLGYGIYQNHEDLNKLRLSRQVLFKVVYAQNKIYGVAEGARDYMSAAMLHPERIESRRRTFESCCRKLSDSLASLDKAIEAADAGSAIALKESKNYQRTLMKSIDEVKIGAHDMERMGDYGGINVGPRQITIVMRLSEVCAQGANLLNALVLEVKQQEQLQMRKLEEAQMRLAILGASCVLINGALLAYLVVYFKRGTQRRLAKLAENAAFLSRRRAESIRSSNERDAVQDLDNVLHELAAALNDAEAREKALLEQLNTDPKLER